MKKSPFIGYYGYWVILTYLSVVSAIVGIYFSFNGNIKEALICLMISGVCDMFDGTVARMAKRTDNEKKFGIQIDSLADIISFAILPSVIGYSLFINSPSGTSNTGMTVFTIIIIAIYCLAALTRLAYFNVTEEELQNNKLKRTHYEGLPVTNVALIIPIIYSICICLDLCISEIYNILLLLIAFAFILKVKVPKLKLSYIITIGLVGLLIVVYVFFIKGM